MKLKRVHVISSNSCNGLLNGLDVSFPERNSDFDPICLVGPNGSGKSQFLQATAEIFQSILAHFHNEEERDELNTSSSFEVEYEVTSKKLSGISTVTIKREFEKRKPKWSFKVDNGGEVKSEDTYKLILDYDLLPKMVIGYTSGDNETLSAPFYISRAAYAKSVQDAAMSEFTKLKLKDNRLQMIDGETHQEAFLANLLGNTTRSVKNFVNQNALLDVHSFRIVIQLAHTGTPTTRSPNSDYAGVQLSAELKQNLKNLQRCATCFDFEKKDQRYTLDFLVTDETRKAIRHFWKDAADFFKALHKFALLNDLMVKSGSRTRYLTSIKKGQYTYKLAKPSEDDLVFRIESVKLLQGKNKPPTDYASLSDGEHQRAQILSMFNMIKDENVLFLLDEPESHFNPKWRVEFIRTLRDLMPGNKLNQDCVLTTHSPFVPSDMKKDNVFVFEKEGRQLNVENPKTETFGATFDAIISDCFDISPPVSKFSLGEFERLFQSEDVVEIKNEIDGLGNAIHRALLKKKLREMGEEVTD